MRGFQRHVQVELASLNATLERVCAKVDHCIAGIENINGLSQLQTNSQEPPGEDPPVQPHASSVGLPAVQFRLPEATSLAMDYALPAPTVFFSEASGADSKARLPEAQQLGINFADHPQHSPKKHHLDIHGVKTNSSAGSLNTIHAMASNRPEASHHNSMIKRQLSDLARRQRSRSEFSVQTWSFLENPDSGWFARFYAKSMPVLIVASVVVTLLQTVEEHQRLLSPRSAAVVETSVEAAFIMDLLMRFAVCPNRYVFFVNFHNIVDLVSVVPLFLRGALGFVMNHDMETSDVGMFLCCAVPTIRFLKVLRFFPNFMLLLNAFQLAWETLPILLFTLALITLCFSSLIFLVEDRNNVPTLPTAIWLSIVTATTVGYGDIVPRSGLGSVIVAALVISSVLYMAIPLGLIGHAFTEVWMDRHRILLVKRARDCLTQRGYSAPSIQLLFRHIDADGSGDLDFSEFHTMLREMGIGLAEEHVSRLFESMDKDGSGAISEREFMRALFPKYQPGAPRLRA